MVLVIQERDERFLNFLTPSVMMILGVLLSGVGLLLWGISSRPIVWDKLTRFHELIALILLAIFISLTGLSSIWLLGVLLFVLWFLLGIGLIVQGLPPLSPSTWAVVLWLAVVNTALAFFLWNKTLQVLTAVEATIINSTMLIQIAVLAWLFLGEALNVINVIGLALAAIGVFIVNWKPVRQE